MINRHITSFVKQSLKDFSAVLIIGARQVGKSTVVKQLYDEGIFKSYITLDDISQLEAVTHDPHGFIKNASYPLAIDEIQRAPDLLKAIKKFCATKTPTNGLFGKLSLAGASKLTKVKLHSHHNS